ncbi:MAG: chemotaxis protein CheW [Lachnospiraceae bacterium]|nr:chemotaxis protein CheW [Lachnospiraceae bacterium]
MVEFKPVVFKVGKEEYGVNINIVRGIEKVLPIVPMHNANKNIKGIINLRGDIIPIYSLRRKFGLPEAEYTEETKFIIAKTDEFLIGLEVDSVGEIQNVEAENIFGIPKIIASADIEYYENILNVNGRIIVMIDVSKLLNKEEAKLLQDAIKKME